MLPAIERSAVCRRLCRVVARLAVISVATIVPTAVGAASLNALVWCDHADPALLGPFEEANDLTVNVKEYEGTGAGLAIIEQSQPGDWDVMVIDSIDVRRGVERGLFAPLPEEELPIEDMYPEVRLDQFTTADGKRYAITEKFGYNTISFNRDEVDVADMRTLRSLSDPKYQGRLALYDYYLPVIGMAALATGKKTAELTAEDLRSRTCCCSGRPMPASSARSPPARPRSLPARPTSWSAAANGSPPSSPRRTRRSTSRSPGRAASSGRSRSPCSRTARTKTWRCNSSSTS
jgi:spermidine/putrescine-binding protein